MIDFDKLLKQEQLREQNKQKVKQNMTGKNPDYNGKVQFENNGNRADAGKIALWINEEPSKETSPLFTGTVTVENKIYRVAIWKNTPKQNPTA
jgi:hypothetical protein